MTGYDPMNYALFTDVALACDLPAHGLRRGDVVRLVDHHLGANGEGYSIEVFNAWAIPWQSPPWMKLHSNRYRATKC